MPRTFAYVRVLTVGQTTENQIQEIEAAGFKVDPRWRRHHPIRT
jgi:putative DNA-invertase from lambdoid prophage Rac